MAAVLASGNDAVLSHTSAARLWGIWRGHEGGTHVVSRRFRHDLADVVRHRSRRLEPIDVVQRNGIPVTTVARTIIDLADILTPHQLANVLHEAAYHKLLDLNQLRLAVARLHGRPTLYAIESAIHAHVTGSAGTRSRLEDRFAAHVCDQDDIDQPRSNTKVMASGRTLEVDFLWFDQQVVVEIDGPAHRRPRSRKDDATRDQLLRAAGFTVLRFAADDIAHHPEVMMEQLRRALALTGQ